MYRNRFRLNFFCRFFFSLPSYAIFGFDFRLHILLNIRVYECMWMCVCVCVTLDLFMVAESIFDTRYSWMGQSTHTQKIYWKDFSTNCWWWRRWWCYAWSMCACVFVYMEFVSVWMCVQSCNELTVIWSVCSVCFTAQLSSALGSYKWETERIRRSRLRRGQKKKEKNRRGVIRLLSSYCSEHCFRRIL